VVGFTPRPIYPRRKSSRYPLDWRLGGPQSRSGRGGEEKISQPPPGIEAPNPDRPARSQSLYRLSYPGCLKGTECEMNSYGSGQGALGGCYEYSNETSGSIKVAEFLDRLSYFQLLKKDSVHRS
jgi:hypothetical protein